MTDPKPHPLSPLIDTVRWPTQSDIDALRELQRILGDLIPAIKALQDEEE